MISNQSEMNRMDSNAMPKKTEAGKKPIDGLLWPFYDLAQSFC